METIDKIMELSNSYNGRVEKSSRELNLICKGHTNQIGLVDDEFRNSKEYQDARAQFEKDFAMLRAFNSTIPKHIQRQMSTSRRNKRITNKTK